MRKVDCFGEICPIPVLRLQSLLADNVDEIMIVSDHSCAVENVRDFCKNKSLDVNVVEVINGVWEIEVKKHKL